LKKISLLIVLAAAVSFTADAQNKQNQPAGAGLKTSLDSVSYSIGVNIAKNLKSQGIENVDAETMAKAIKDVYGTKTLLINPDEANRFLGTYFQKMQQKKAEENTARGKKFLEENKNKTGVVTLPSGLQYQVIKEGTGEKPAATDKVTVHYHGTLIDGTVFDSSVDRGQPASFGLNQVIKGWTEGVQLMKVGSKYRFFIPAELAYGEQSPSPVIGPNSTLIFDVELLSIDK
jgi:FKBP-type peptidyl-prolyl cis-trans isomerase FklB